MGRNYVEEPWEPTDSHLSEVSRLSLEVNLLTEDNLPYYHLALWETFGSDGVWGEWVRRWTAEEGRHAIVLRDYLTVTRGLDPVALERGRMETVCRGYYPDGKGGSSPIRSTGSSTRRCRSWRPGSRTATPGQYTDDPLIEKLTAPHRDRREPALRLLPRARPRPRSRSTRRR